MILPFIFPKDAFDAPIKPTQPTMNIHNYNCSFYPTENEAYTLIDSALRFYLTNNKNFTLSNEKSFTNILQKNHLFAVFYVQFNEFTFTFNRTLLGGFNVTIYLPTHSFVKTFTSVQLLKMHAEILPQSSIQHLLF